MRGWMNEGKSYYRAGGHRRGTAPAASAWWPRRTLPSRWATRSARRWAQEYCLIPGRADPAQRPGIDTRLGSQTQWLNVLGMPGSMTGYFGLMDGQPRAGETVVVSAPLARWA